MPDTSPDAPGAGTAFSLQFACPGRLHRAFGTCHGRVPERCYNPAAHRDRSVAGPMCEPGSVALDGVPTHILRRSPMNQKLLVLLAAGAFAFSLSACKNETDTAKTEAAEASAAMDQAGDKMAEAADAAGNAAAQGVDAAAAATGEAAGEAAAKVDAAADAAAAATADAAATAANATADAANKVADKADAVADKADAAAAEAKK